MAATLAIAQSAQPAPTYKIKLRVPGMVITPPGSGGNEQPAAVSPTLSPFAPGMVVVGEGPATLTPPASSSPGTWSFVSSNTAVATISGSTVTPVAAGTTTITATQAAATGYTSASVSATLTVAGAASAVLGASNSAFGSTNVGSSSAPLTLTYSKTGGITLSGVSLAALPSGLSASVNTCGTPAAPVNLAVGASCEVSLVWVPTTAGSSNLPVSVNANNTASQLVNLSGVGVALVAGSTLTTDPSPASYGLTVPVGGTSSTAITITYTSTGNTPVTGLHLNLASGLAATSNTCGTFASRATLPEGQSCQATLTWSPTAVGAASMVVTLAADNVASRSATLTGTAIMPSLARCSNLPSGFPSGLYEVDPDGPGPLAAIQAYCDMTRDGGGWTLVARVLTGSKAHATPNAVGSLTSPTQSTAAKLSDTYINALKQNHYALRDDGSRAFFFQATSNFAAATIAPAYPQSASINGPFVAGVVNSYHGGLNGYPADGYLIYGSSSPGSDNCRLGLAVPTPAWCSAGANGTMWVR